MVSAQPGPNGDFGRVSQKVGEIGEGPETSEVFHTTIQNAQMMLEYMPHNLVDFRTCPRVPESMREQDGPESRWVMLSALRGIEVAYSKEFINWKLWGIDEETSRTLRAGFSEDDPGYLVDYGTLGLAAKREANARGLNGEDRFEFCVDYILKNVRSTPHSELGLFGAWLSEGKIQPQFVRVTAHEALTT